MTNEQRVRDLLTTSRLVECIICGEPTTRRFVWVPEENVSKEDREALRCVLYGICDNHHVSDGLLDSLTSKIKSHFN